MNPTPFQQLIKLLEAHAITKEEFSKRWDQEKTNQNK